MRNRIIIPVLLFAIAIFAAAADDGPSVSVRVHPAPKNPTNLRVDVNMALVPVTVMDSIGRNVTGLTPQNFRIFDGPKQVPIISFARQDQPISVGLIFDCSRSMTDKYKIARQAPAALYSQLNPGDESFLVTFSTAPTLRQDYTSEFSDIGNALLFTHPDGTTALFDAVLLGLSHLKEAHNPRKALVIVSDGGDNNSRYTLRELERIAVESDTQIFAIGLHQNPQAPEEVEGPAFLNDLVGKTGGIHFVIENLNDMSQAMSKIGVTLHNQYVLGYYPPSGEQSGKYRQIKVQLLVPKGLPPMTIHARAGYYVPGR